METNAAGHSTIAEYSTSRPTEVFRFAVDSWPELIRSIHYPSVVHVCVSYLDSSAVYGHGSGGPCDDDICRVVCRCTGSERTARVSTRDEDDSCGWRE